MKKFFIIITLLILSGCISQSDNSYHFVEDNLSVFSNEKPNEEFSTINTISGSDYGHITLANLIAVKNHYVIAISIFKINKYDPFFYNGRMRFDRGRGKNTLIEIGKRIGADLIVNGYSESSCAEQINEAGKTECKSYDYQNEEYVIFFYKKLSKK